MDFKDMEILVECRRLVERLLQGEKYIFEHIMDKSGNGAKVVQQKIDMMERALEGKPPLTFEEIFGRELNDDIKRFFSID